MAKIGLKCPVAAQITGYDHTTRMPQYAAGFIIGKAITAEKSIESNSNPLYGDDSIVENDTSFSSGTIKLGVTDFGEDYQSGLMIQGKMLGSEVRQVNTGDSSAWYIRRGAIQAAPELGFGFYKTKKHNGQYVYEATWLYKTQFKTPSDSTNTKGQSIEWQTPEIEGVVMAVEGFDGDTYEDTAVFTTETAARSWLYEKANIEPDADRTALSNKISEIRLLDSETYTSSSWYYMAAALNETEIAIKKSYMSAAEVQSLTLKLGRVQGELVERSV